MNILESCIETFKIGNSFASNKFIAQGINNFIDYFHISTQSPDNPCKFYSNDRVFQLQLHKSFYDYNSFIFEVYKSDKLIQIARIFDDSSLLIKNSADTCRYLLTDIGVRVYEKYESINGEVFLRDVENDVKLLDRYLTQEEIIPETSYSHIIAGLAATIFCGIKTYSELKKHAIELAPGVPPNSTKYALGWLIGTACSVTYTAIAIIDTMRKPPVYPDGIKRY